MKRIVIYILLIIGLSGCKENESVLVFDALPEERIKARIDELYDILPKSEHGWKGFTTTLDKGGYGFFLEFDANRRVKMMSDITDEAATTPVESSYRVKAISNATLIFDTYNYLTLLQDPNPNSFGGTRGTGFRSDIEFDYVRTTPDSVILSGRRFLNPLVLVKATAAEKNRYTGGDYLNSINDFKTFYNGTPNLFIDLDDGTPYGLTYDASNKKFSINWVAEDTVRSAEGMFYYDLSGIRFIHPITLNGKLIYGIQYASNSSGRAIGEANTQYAVENYGQPVVPLNLSIGYTHNNFFLGHNQIYPGTESLASEVLGRFWTYMPLTAAQAPPGRKRFWFNPAQVTMRFENVNQRVFFDFRVTQNANTWTDTFRFDYTRNADGSMTFVRVGNGSINYVDLDFAEWSTYLHNKTYDIAYYSEGGVTYAKFTSRDDLGFAFTLTIP